MSDRTRSDASAEELAAAGLVPTMWDSMADAQASNRGVSDARTTEKAKSGEPKPAAEPSTPKQKE
jgi:hypothetical protein